MKWIRKVVSEILILCIAFFALPVQVFAEETLIASGTCGENAVWNLTEDGTITISGTGEMVSCYNTSCPWGSYRKLIKKAIVEDGITTIGSYAFRQCENLEVVEIASTVTSINIQAFYNCYALKSITFPVGLRDIEQSAFYSCGRLKNIYFEGDKPSINRYSFTGTVATVYYPANNMTWTETGRQNYGGTLTWMAVGAEDEAEEISITVNNVVGSVSAPEGGWKEGTNTFNVVSEKACVVAVSYDGGVTYTRLTAFATGMDNTYRFTADDVTESSIVAVIMTGDTNGDGSITNADVTRLKAAYQNKVQLDGLKWLAADVNNSGDITNADVTRLKAVYQNKTSFSW